MSLAPSDAMTEYHARKLCEIGVDMLGQGQVDQALATFDESLALKPTAEGYTFRGWARSFHGEYDGAIHDCRRAIHLDRDFGNPYNDIGVYLMQLGRLDESVRWLNRAKLATRYDTPHFPFLNMGHVLMIQNRQNEALYEYVCALEFDPENEIAREAIASMDMTF